MSIKAIITTNTIFMFLLIVLQIIITIFMTLLTKISKSFQTKQPMYNKYDKDLADKMITKFCAEFWETFHIYPEVRYVTSYSPLPRTGLTLIEELINEVFCNDPTLEYKVLDVAKDKGIRSTKRFKLLITYRQCFMKIASDTGYGSTDIARFLGFDHATVLHAKKRIKDLLDTKDAETVEIYNKIVNAYKIRFSNDGDVQQDSGERPDA